MTAFYIIATLTMICGVAAVSLRNVVHCVLALIGFFAGIAAVFFTLRAEFLGAVQIIVYVGAVAVLLLFAVMLTRRVTGEAVVSPFSGGSVWGLLVSAAVLCAILYSIPDADAFPPSPGATPLSVANLGQALMTRYAIPFEVISLLLTAALVGAVVIATEEPKGEKSRSSDS